MAGSPSRVILETKKIKSVTASTFSPYICYEVMEPDTMILVLWVFSFKPAFPLSSFTLIRRLFGSSSLSAIRVVSSPYLRLLMFLPSILIPSCDSSSLAFRMMYTVVFVQPLSRVSLFVTPMDCNMPGFLVLHHLPELAQTHIHRVGDAIQPSHPLLSLSSPAFNLFQSQGLF